MGAEGTSWKLRKIERKLRVGSFAVKGTEK